MIVEDLLCQQEENTQNIPNLLLEPDGWRQKFRSDSFAALVRPQLEDD